MPVEECNQISILWKNQGKNQATVPNAYPIFILGLNGGIYDDRSALPLVVYEVESKATNCTKDHSFRLVVSLNSLNLISIQKCRKSLDFSFKFLTKLNLIVPYLTLRLMLNSSCFYMFHNLSLKCRATGQIRPLIPAKCEWKFHLPLHLLSLNNFRSVFNLISFKLWNWIARRMH